MKALLDKNALTATLNDAYNAADDVTGALEHLAILYGTLAAKDRGDDEARRLAATFSTLHAQAQRVSGLLETALG